MTDNKTKPTGASVSDYIASKANARQRADCRQLMAMFKRVTGHRPRMWGPSIVGYGSYRYTYESGRTGEAAVAGFSIRGRDLVVYVAQGPWQKPFLAKLGKHSIGQSCLYFRQLADLDPKVLERFVVASIAQARLRYGRDAVRKFRSHRPKGTQELVQNAPRLVRLIGERHVAALIEKNDS